MTMPALVRTVSSYYAKSGRHHLPWRQTQNPYRILVSEVMLQQTQVDRVLPKYKLFVKKFPTVQALAEAPLSEVLLAWSGLGYNRRAKYLQQAAKVVAEKYNRTFPQDVKRLEELPGVGHYTARAVAIFAFNKPEVCIETNIRTVFLHHCFADASAGEIADATLFPLIEQALRVAHRQGIESRHFYAALMDYGTHLKASGVKLNAQSKHYIKQKKFAGSTRQLRGAIVRALLAGPATVKQIKDFCARAQKSILYTEVKIEHELLRLQKEGLVIRRGRQFALAG